MRRRRGRETRSGCPVEMRFHECQRRGRERGGARTNGRPTPRRDAPRSRKHRASRAPDSVSSSRRTRVGRGPPSAGHGVTRAPSLHSSPTGSLGRISQRSGRGKCMKIRRVLNKILSIAYGAQFGSLRELLEPREPLFRPPLPGSAPAFPPKKQRRPRIKREKTSRSTPSTTGAVARALRPSPRAARRKLHHFPVRGALSEVDAPRTPRPPRPNPRVARARAIPLRIRRPSWFGRTLKPSWFVA